MKFFASYFFLPTSATMIVFPFLSTTPRYHTVLQISSSIKPDSRGIIVYVYLINSWGDINCEPLYETFSTSTISFTSNQHRFSPLVARALISKDPKRIMLPSSIALKHILDT